MVSTRDQDLGSRWTKLGREKNAEYSGPQRYRDVDCSNTQDDLGQARLESLRSGGSKGHPERQHLGLKGVATYETWPHKYAESVTKDLSKDVSLMTAPPMWSNYCGRRRWAGP